MDTNVTMPIEEYQSIKDHEDKFLELQKSAGYYVSYNGYGGYTPSSIDWVYYSTDGEFELKIRDDLKKKQDQMQATIAGQEEKAEVKYRNLQIFCFLTVIIHLIFVFEL